MKFTVGYNWDPNLLDKINYPKVESVYSGDSSSVIGGGRASVVIKDIEEEEVRKNIKLVHDRNLEFDYTLNSGCTSNREFTKEGYKEIINYIDNVYSLGVDSVTVTLPSLVSIIKKYYPKLKVKISTFQRIGSVEMVRRFEELGADAVMICEHSNRDFKLLRKIREAVDCKLALVANVGCVFYCINAHSHIVSTSHSSTTGECNSIFTAVPYTADCLTTRLKDLSEYIKMRYIRPEDVNIYEEIGIDLLKICDRHTKTDVLADRVKAYSERSFKGNLMNLLGQKADKKTDEMNVDMVKNIVGDNEEAKEKTFKFFNYVDGSISDLVYIDNSKFPKEFIEVFENIDCSKRSCGLCGYCKEVSENVITYDKEKINEFLAKLKELKNSLVDGSILY
jgi:collagenase-like PrtC family protease